jgi:aspartyl/glutamyl-tRNA(Asn/Gln) amidotransferase C subunit
MTDENPAPEVDIAALATLARIEVTAEETARLQKEIPDILAFVKVIQEASADAPKVDPAHRNIMRDDVNPRASETFTEKILAGAPARKGNHVAVKQVISRKK